MWSQHPPCGILHPPSFSHPYLVDNCDRGNVVTCYRWCTISDYHFKHLNWSLSLSLSLSLRFPQWIPPAVLLWAVARPVMVCPLTLHVPVKPHLYLWQLSPFLNLLDWPLTHLGHWPTSHSLSWTLTCSCYLSLLDTLDSPCLYFGLWPSTLTLALWSWLLDSVPDSYIVADIVGTPQLDLWGLPLCQLMTQFVTFVQLATVLEYLCMCVASSQCCPHKAFYIDRLEPEVFSR